MSQECSELHELIIELDRYEFPFNPKDIPQNGIYLLFEKGEEGHGSNRIVRIGTHTGVGQLQSRLKQHFIRENKDRSIFRKNIGRAYLSKSGDPFLADWEIDLTKRAAKEKYQSRINLNHQQEIEMIVSKIIQDNFTFSVFQVRSKEERLRIESLLISTVSLCNECFPSVSWLGQYSPKEKIVGSGLWQVNELYKTPLSKNDLNNIVKIIH